MSALPPDAIEVDAGRVSIGSCELYEIKSQVTANTEGAQGQLERALLLVRWARHVVLEDPQHAEVKLVGCLVVPREPGEAATASGPEQPNSGGDGVFELLQLQLTHL